jgi:hypothetical protein
MHRTGFCAASVAAVTECAGPVIRCLAICLCLGGAAVRADEAPAPSLDDPKYDGMKTEFLNVDTAYFAEVVFADYFGDSSQDLVKCDGNNLLELRINEGGFMGWHTFGGTYWADSMLHGTKSLARYMTGGSPHNRGPVGGSSVENDYATALAHPERIYKRDEWAVGSGTRLWIGAGARDTFLLPLFEKLKHGPANRICFEVELPVDRMRFASLGRTRDGGDPERAQLVNPKVAHDHVDWVRAELGTYTSVYGSDLRGWTNNPETGGTFNGGGTHFYHQPSMYQRCPLDKAYALSENTIVFCFGPVPSGVRSGMRPPFSINPLMTVVGDNADGLTDAYQYIPYLTRVYFDIHSAETRHPATVKYNKVWVMYEENDIQALSGQGSVLGVDMACWDEPAIHPFTVFNNAPEDRSYRLTVMAGGNLAFDSTNASLRIFIDENGNRIRDAGENTELVPAGTVTLPAKTDLALIAVHRPNWESTYDTNERYNRRFAPAGITLQEVGRMRMTSYAIRTWLGTAAEVANKTALLQQMRCPTPDSIYSTQAAWNQDKPNNPRLIRNTPDFQMALRKLAGQAIKKQKAAN